MDKDVAPVVQEMPIKKAKTAEERAREEFKKSVIPVHLPEIGDETGTEAVKVDQTVPVGLNGEFMIVTRGPLAEVTPEMFVIMKQTNRFPGL